MGVEVTPAWSEAALSIIFLKFVNGDNNITLSTSATEPSLTTKESKIDYYANTLQMGDLFSED